MQGTILPSSHRKINQCKALFDKYMDTNTLVGQLEAVEAYSAAAGGGRWRLGGGERWRPTVRQQVCVRV